jgi:leucyl aminopeptidase (aminopeptidase T)
MILTRAVKAVFEGSLKLKRGESCLIVTDTIEEAIGRAFYDYARSITDRAAIKVMEPASEHAAEPTEDVREEMLKYDVQLLVTYRSLTHTKARVAATKRGARIATMPSITEDIANRCLDIDYDALKKESQKIYSIIKDASLIRVVTEKGTDIVFKPGGSSFFGKDGGSFDQPGAFGNLPEGEVAFMPENCEGTYVVDASFPDIGLLDSPLVFRTENGVVNEITGQRSQEVRRRLEKAGPKAWRVAELGIGLNPKAKITGIILEDEKVIGTVHIAVGNNLSFGGDNDVKLHLDGVITKPTVYVDGKVLMEKGKFRRWIIK